MADAIRIAYLMPLDTHTAHVTLGITLLDPRALLSITALVSMEGAIRTAFIRGLVHHTAPAILDIIRIAVFVCQLIIVKQPTVAVIRIASTPVPAPALAPVIQDIHSRDQLARLLIVALQIMVDVLKTV